MLPWHATHLKLEVHNCSRPDEPCLLSFVLQAKRYAGIAGCMASSGNPCTKAVIGQHDSRLLMACKRFRAASIKCEHPSYRVCGFLSQLQPAAVHLTEHAVVGQVLVACFKMHHMSFTS